MSFAIMNTVPKTMFEEHFDAVEFMFQSGVSNKGLKLSDARMETMYYTYIPGDENDEDDCGYSIPSSKENATHVRIAYFWKDEQ